MQVVYSGGSTPTPSPRLQRKQYHGYGRPIMPGYVPGSSTPPIHHRVCKEKHHDAADNESSLRDSIPAMSKSVAITCLIFNILMPGLGTFVGGLTVLCGSRIRLKGSTKQKVIWANTWVALFQFLTAFLFLLGWIWSIVWGAAFLSISNEFYRRSASKDKKSPDRQNGVNINLVPRTGSSPHISGHHLEKPIMLRSSSADQPTQPMIVLQKAPIISQSESNLSPSKPIMDARTRYHKILKRQMSDNELSPFNLTEEGLQKIVVHDMPPRRGILRRDATVTSNASAASGASDTALQT